MIEDKLQKIKNNAIELTEEIETLERMLETQKYGIKIDQTADGYTGCYSCAYNYDSESMCILRLCKHAIHTLKECYKER